MEKAVIFYYILLFNQIKIHGLIKLIENDYIKCHKNIYSCDFYQRQDTMIDASCGQPAAFLPVRPNR